MIGRRRGCVSLHVAVITLTVGGVTGLDRADDPAQVAHHVDSPIILTQLPAHPDSESRPDRCGGMLRGGYGEGGRIVRIDPSGETRVLTGGFSSASGADVSFDGKRFLFAAKRAPHDPWDIWEMGADGTDARRITRDLGNCRSPAYQATLYTIVSTEPWYQIMFVSDAAGAMNEYGCGPATSLYSCRLDGSSERRLTWNLSDDFDPFLAQDGRVLLASWQRADLRRGFNGRVSLFGVNTDGADYALYCGDQGSRIKHMPCATSDGLVVFVEAEKVGWDGAGQLASITTRRNFHSHTRITHDATVLYHSPSPLPDGSLLVSRRPVDGSATHAVYRLDPRTGWAGLIFDDPDFHDIHARALVPRVEPDGRSSVVNEKYPTGKLYCLNAYITDPGVQRHLRPGMIRRVRVIEGVPLSTSAESVFLPGRQKGCVSGPGSSVNSLVPVVQKRLLGVVPVEEDGSFQIELPADLPVQLQTLDENGMALQTCGWIWAKHREPRGCVGCHEDPELTPENRFVLALRKAAVDLTFPAEDRRNVDFRRDVMPILTSKCKGCHNGRESALGLGDATVAHFNRAYVSLLAEASGLRSEGEPVTGKYVHPGRARTSPLIWRLFGRNTSRPWDATYDRGWMGMACPPPEAQPLSDDEKMTFVEWIDLGAHFDGIPGPEGLTGDAGRINKGENNE